MKQIENEFIKKINAVYEECVDTETYSNITEFSDEDGVVLMTVEELDGENQGKLLFTFTDDGETFIYKKLNEEEKKKELEKEAEEAENSKER